MVISREALASEAVIHLVTPSWVARKYGVSTLKVYRAIHSGKLEAVKLRGGSLVLDERTLPARFPQ